MKVDNYKTYLHSSEWKERRDKFILSHPYCQICGSTTNLEVHHLTYYEGGESILGKEKDWHLMTLCHDHHNQIHTTAKTKKEENEKRYEGRIISWNTDDAHHRVIAVLEYEGWFHFAMGLPWGSVNSPHSLWVEDNVDSDAVCISDADEGEVRYLINTLKLIYNTDRAAVYDNSQHAYFFTFPEIDVMHSVELPHWRHGSWSSDCIKPYHTNLMQLKKYQDLICSIDLKSRDDESLFWARVQKYYSPKNPLIEIKFNGLSFPKFSEIYKPNIQLI